MSAPTVILLIWLVIIVFLPWVHSVGRCLSESCSPRPSSDDGRWSERSRSDFKNYFEER